MQVVEISLIQRVAGLSLTDHLRRTYSRGAAPPHRIVPVEVV